MIPDEDPARPTVDDVALLLRTRTVGGVAQGLGGDTGPAELTTFDETTRPTADEVERIIQTAESAMTAKLSGALPEGREGAMRHVVALYAATLIEVSFFRETGTADQLATWRSLTAELVASLNETIADAGGGSPHVARFGSLVIGSIRAPVVPNHDPVRGIDF